MNKDTEILTKEEVKEIVTEAVKQTLTELGIASDEPIEMQQDFAHLRSWRESSEAVQRKGLLALIGIFISGFIGLIIVGIQAVLKSSS